MHHLVAVHTEDRRRGGAYAARRSEEHTSELQSHSDLVCRLLLEKKHHRSRGGHHPSLGVVSKPSRTRVNDAAQAAPDATAGSALDPQTGVEPTMLFSN